MNSSILVTLLFLLSVQFVPSENQYHPQPCSSSSGVVSKCYEWTGWTACDVTCGTGTRSCNLLCNLYLINALYPRTSSCFKTVTQACHSHFPCPPVNGGWSSYAYDSCTVSCGGGTQTGTRTCTNPPPQYGGTSCSGSSTNIQACNSDPCPVDGGWSEYGALGACSQTCGPGTATQTRVCDNPPPVGGSCPGLETNTVECNDGPCPVDGGWSDFFLLTGCTATCGSGTENYMRFCDSPPESGGGLPCQGDDTETRECNSADCPVNGGWSDFSNAGTCCGNGNTQLQTRECKNPAPVGIGVNCTGPATQYVACTAGPCNVDGNWSAFGPVDTCSNTCGPGVQMQLRTCTNPAPSGSGATCTGTNTHTVACETAPC